MEQAKSILPRLFQGTSETIPWNLDLVRAYWPEAVGPLLARHSEPVRIQPPTLFVQVADLAWLEEFKPMQRQIVLLLQQEMGSPAVNRIRFQAREPAQPRGPIARQAARAASRGRRKP